MPRTRPPLTRDAVLDAALSVIDRAGVEGCTMRAVAADLGVEAMSLYWHVDGKEALLDGVVERLLAQVDPPPSPAGDWRGGLAAVAREYRAVALAHARAVPLLASRAGYAYATAGRMAAGGIASLEAAGFDRPDAIRAARTLARYVVGFTLADAGAGEPPDADVPPAVAELLEAVAREDPEELFTFGLETLLDGLELRLRRASPPA